MSGAFADTSFFVAFLAPRDQFHGPAVAAMSALSGRVVTSDWVLVELANYMAKTSLRLHAAGFIRTIQNDPRFDVVPSSAAAIEAGLVMYEQHHDKQWSLTDCISFQIMRQEGLSQALTADHHFAQAGFEILLK
jgi:predicted nucleic acid-binding protein